MKRVLFVFFVAGAFVALADTTPIATVALDNGSPAENGSDWDWTYTITVTNGDLYDVGSFEIFDVAGVVDTSAPWWEGWRSSYTPVGGGLYDVTFTNVSDPCYDCKLDGFTIESTFGAKGITDYAVIYDTCGEDQSGGKVGVPMAATPEPATAGLVGLPLLALAAYKFRRKQPRNSE